MIKSCSASVHEVVYVSTRHVPLVAQVAQMEMWLYLSKE